LAIGFGECELCAKPLFSSRTTQRR
jgi:hypothetical protein